MQSPCASCNFVLSLHAPQGVRPGIPVNFRSIGVGFVCARFKGNITVLCLSWAELLVWKEREAGICCHTYRIFSPSQEHKTQQSLPQTLPDKSRGIELTSESWSGASVSFSVHSAGSLSPLKGSKSDSQTKKVLLLVFRIFPMKQPASSCRQQSSS